METKQRERKPRQKEEAEAMSITKREDREKLVHKEPLDASYQNKTGKMLRLGLLHLIWNSKLRVE